MNYIKTYEEIKFKNLNPLNLFKSKLDIDDILKKLDMTSLGKVEKSSSKDEYETYTVKFPTNTSMSRAVEAAYRLDDIYSTIRLNKDRDQYQINIYIKFDKDVIENKGSLNRKLRGSLLSIVGLGYDPRYINSPGREETLTKIAFDRNVQTTLYSPVLKYTGKDAMSKLESELSQIIQNLESYYKYVVDEIKKVNSESTQADVQRRIREEQRRESLEKKKLEEEKRKEIIRKKQEYYKKIMDDIEDYFIEIQDLVVDDQKSSNDNSIRWDFKISDLKGGVYRMNDWVEINDKQEAVLRALLQAKKRISHDYPNIKISIKYTENLLQLVIADVEFNKKYSDLKA